MLGLAYYGVAALCLAFTSGADGIASVWPPSGLLFAALLTVPRRTLWRFAGAAGIGSLAANIGAGVPIWMAIGFTCANVVEALVATLLMRRRGQVRVSFVDPQGGIAFCTASLLAAIVSATIATVVSGDPSTHFALSWFATVLLGLLIVTPLLLTSVEIAGSDAPGAKKPRAFDAIMVALISSVVSLATFFQDAFPILFLPMIAMLFAVFRCGAFGVVVSMVVIAVCGSIALSLGHGPMMLIGQSRDVQVQFFQFYLLAILASALPMATLLAGRDSLRVSLAERVRLLSLAERAAQIGHWRIDPLSRAVYWSPEVYRIHAVAMGETPSLDRGIDAYHVDDRLRVAAIVQQALDDGKPFEFTARIVRPDGSIRHVVSRGERDFKSKDDAIGLFGLIQDVTDQIEAQRVLNAAREAAERSADAALALADTDVLTALPNRRKIIRQLETAFAVAVADGAPLSVAIFDIDHFKSINDRFGHFVGDQVLRRVGRTAAGALRDSDMIGRFGGEEFILVLPGATQPIATQIAERVRAAIEEGGADETDPPVTASIGIATLTDDVSPQAMLQRADRALYAAKNAGRNRLSSAA